MFKRLSTEDLETPIEMDDALDRDVAPFPGAREGFSHMKRVGDLKAEAKKVAEALTGMNINYEKESSTTKPPRSSSGVFAILLNSNVFRCSGYQSFVQTAKQSHKVRFFSRNPSLFANRTKKGPVNENSINRVKSRYKKIRKKKREPRSLNEVTGQLARDLKL